MKTTPIPSYGYRPPVRNTSSLVGSLIVSAIMLAVVIYATRP
jgi:hypothetical protein